MARKMLKENPDLNKTDMTRPIITNALTHGLSLVGDMFVNSGDTILLPTHNWGNYKLVYSTRHSLFSKHMIFLMKMVITLLML